MDTPEKPVSSDEQNHPDLNVMSRRGFLKRSGAIVALASIGTVANSCAPSATPTAPSTTPVPPELRYPDVLPAPNTPPELNILRFFTPHEAQTIDAITARILPGTPDDPGAHEAGVVIYIDNLLAFREGFPEATYREPPFVELYEGDDPLDQAADSGQFAVIRVPAGRIERYGYQSMLTPREVYRIGLAAVDSYVQAKFSKRFIDLNGDERDVIVGDLADNKPADFFKQFSAEAFFSLLRRHTSEGMFSDPVYGGNRDMVGWKLIGYPGAQRAYTPQEITTEGSERSPQELSDMAHFHPGEPAGPHVVLPVSGSDHKGHQHGPKKDPFWPIESK